MTSSRESNYDLLRVLSTFSVVLLHTSSSFLKFNELDVPLNLNFPIMLLHVLTRFAVPCFFMLSGAFLLSNEQNADHKYFYKKSAKTIGITGALFCLLYVLYDIVKLIVELFLLKTFDIAHIANGVCDIFVNAFTGHPFGHLWYLCTLLGLYLATPFVIQFAENLRRGGVNIYGKTTIIFLTLSILSYITSDHTLSWDIGLQFCYISYFLMGYKLRMWGKRRKNNCLGLLMVLLGVIINIMLAYINYKRGVSGLPVNTARYDMNPFSFAPLAPIEVIASCFIFAGFSVMKIKAKFSKLAGYTFLIYLLHMGVLDVILFLADNYVFRTKLFETVSAVLISAGVFTISLGAAFLWKKIALFVMRMRN